MDLKDKLRTLGSQVVNALAQDQAHHNPEKTVTPGMPELLRSAAAQGAVLLENKVLPLAPGTRVALFGRCQIDWFFTGYGSGGDVNAPYAVNALDALCDCPELAVDQTLADTYRRWVVENPPEQGAWGAWPRSHPEMPVTEELIASLDADQAVVILGRSSGEDRENILKPGSYYLTEAEKDMLRCVTARYPQAVLVLNIGCIMDLRFLKEFSFGAVLIAWQAGMESGNALADLLTGRENPSGRLTDTIGEFYEDYPSAAHFGMRAENEYYEDIYVGYRYFETFSQEAVLYPFGHGLSYTSFEVMGEMTGGLGFKATVTNTGAHAGRHAVLLYVEKPQGILGSPSRELAAFGKTGLLQPGETETLEFSLDWDALEVFDEAGLTGHKCAWVLPEGTYRFYLGGDVRSAPFVGSADRETLTPLRQCREAAAPEGAFPILARCQGERGERTAAPKTIDLKQRILEGLPPARFITGDKGIKLSDVASGRAAMDAFLGQLSLEELEAISRGGYIMDHPLGAKGNAGIFGGVTQSLRDKGVPPVVTSDGPSGIRLYDSCSLLPIGTALACSFDAPLLETLGRAVGLEMTARGSDVLLAPGMNIHRNPLCGRNFEYYSEDPLLTGKLAAAFVRGLQSTGKAACPKHFACNNQETNRNKTDSVVSQRALREIYLRGFEICVKEARPKTLMTSYNKINGVWGHYHYDLVTTILRQEWGYTGTVLTDWWMRYAPSPEFPRLTGNGYRVRSGVNVLMPGGRSYADRRQTPDGTCLATYGKAQGITLGELQENARQVLETVMELKQMDN